MHYRALLALASIAISTAVPHSQDFNVTAVMGKRTSDAEAGRDNDRPSGFHWNEELPDGLRVPLEYLNEQGSAPITMRLQHHVRRPTINVQVGYPGKNLSLAVDIRSGQTWVYGKEAYVGHSPHGYKISGIRRYDPRHSKTAHKVDDFTWRQEYTEGSAAEGIMWRDLMRVGGVEYLDQIFGVAKTVNRRLVYYPDMDGVFALGGSDPHRKQHLKPFVNNLGQYLKERNLVTLTLKEDGGFIDFGHLNHSRYTGELFWIRTAIDHTGRPDHFFKSQGYRFGNSSMNFVEMLTSPDTMSPYITMEERYTDEYYDNFPLGVEKVSIPGKNIGYVYPCDFTPPDITLQVMGDHGAVTDLIVPGVETTFQEVRPGWCLGAVVGSPPRISNPEITLGWPFLKNKFVLLQGHTAVAFATAA